MDIRQAEYLKLLGIQAWCQQEDLPQVQENIRALRSMQQSALSQNESMASLQNKAGKEPLSSSLEKMRTASAPAGNQAASERPNFAADVGIDADRFSRQLQDVTAGLRVNINPKLTESIAVKSTFEPRPFQYDCQASIFDPAFSQAVKDCLGCDFSQSRHQATLPRQGEQPLVMIITDIPLKEEMYQGQVLDQHDEAFFFQAMSAVGFTEDTLYITPFIKCRPPELRDVSDKEWHACFQLLKREILEVKPQIIFLLGRTAVKFLLQKELPFESLRRERHLIEIEGMEFPVVISHSPRVYAKNSRLKANFWQDLKFLRRQLG